MKARLSHPSVEEAQADLAVGVQVRVDADPAGVIVRLLREGGGKKKQNNAGICISGGDVTVQTSKKVRRGLPSLQAALRVGGGSHRRVGRVPCRELDVEKVQPVLVGGIRRPQQRLDTGRTAERRRHTSLHARQGLLDIALCTCTEAKALRGERAGPRVEVHPLGMSAHRTD